MTPKQILLVSGPSGGGKSTFIQQLAQGTLAPEILSLLPRDCAKWLLVESNDVLKGDLAEKSFEAVISAGSCVLHYDIVLIHHHGISRYEDDPALRLLSNARPLHVVIILPAAEKLRQQFLDRQHRHQQTKSKFSLLWRRFVRRPIRRTLAALSGKPGHSTEELYARDQWLSDCYSEWIAFATSLPQGSPVIIEPVSNRGQAPEFQLVAEPTVFLHGGPHKK